MIQVFVTPGVQCVKCLSMMQLQDSPMLDEAGNSWLIRVRHDHHSKCEFSGRTGMIRIMTQLVMMDPKPPSDTCELCDAGSEVIDGWHYTRLGGMIFSTNRRCAKCPA